MEQALSLYELKNLVHRVIELNMGDEYWIHAEISELRVNRHCYLEFAQKNADGNGLTAKARGQIWASSWPMIKLFFEKTTGQALSVGMEVLVKVQVTFHELYGYSLNVIDIDPTYTLGDITRKRKEIIDQLRAEGVENMNKELQLSRLLQRIAIISAAGAAGYGDFCNQLTNNRRGLVFSPKLFPATMQGNDVERTVIAALNKIAQEADNWDAVVIIRGGGATTDLSGFDTLALAENVAQFPLPVITGIGHERDDTIIDMISHTRVKTPTAAAEFIIRHQEEELDHVEDLADRLSKATGNILTTEKTRLQMAATRLPSLYANFKLREEARLERTLTHISHAIEQQIRDEGGKTDILERRLALYAQTLISRNSNRLEVLENKIKNADPERILQMGFTLTRSNGKVVKDASKLKPGDRIDTTFINGTLTSIVQ